MFYNTLFWTNIIIIAPIAVPLRTENLITVIGGVYYFFVDQRELHFLAYNKYRVHDLGTSG
jgi:hypothetical protein